MKSRTVKKLVRIRGRLKDRASAAFQREKAAQVSAEQELDNAIDDVINAGCQQIPVYELERLGDVVKMKSDGLEAATQRVRVSQSDLLQSTMEERRAEKVRDRFMQELQHTKQHAEARENDDRSSARSVANKEAGS